MFRFGCYGLSGLLVCSLALVSRGQERDLAPPPKRVLNQDEYYPSVFRGRVTAVSRDTVVIKPEGYCQLTEHRTENGRSILVALYRQDSSLPPRAYVFADSIIGVPIPRRAGQHKPSDIQIGDHIEIVCCRMEDGTDCCTDLRIVRRYGGRVPLAIGDEKLPVKERTSTWLNAVQEREEKSVQALSRAMLRFRP